MFFMKILIPPFFRALLRASPAEKIQTGRSKNNIHLSANNAPRIHEMIEKIMVFLKRNLAGISYLPKHFSFPGGTHYKKVWS
ncbi:MAG: hypothetical protein ABRQ26_14755 [Syntrophomonadaceae bacterium]